MKLLDVSILLGLYRAEHPKHAELREWLRSTLIAGEPISLTPLVVTGFMRISTNPRVYPLVTPPAEARAQIDQLLRAPLVSWAMPGPRHWEIFSRICTESNAYGNLVTDAAIAAIAVEHGAALVTLDRDFARFPDVRWEHPST